MENNELVHHGIKGMRWGVRRYQNKDGSLTPAGKKRVAKLRDEYDRLTGSKGATKDEGSSNKPAQSSSGKKRLSERSNEELKRETERNRIERDYIDSILSRQKTIDDYRKANAPAISTGQKILKRLSAVAVPAVEQAGSQLLKELLTQRGKELMGLKNTQNTQNNQNNQNNKNKPNN